MIAPLKSCNRAISRAELRREKLLDTARNLFIVNGFHATGIAQIAKESGIAVGQIYRDFCSKEAIVAALVNTDCDKFLEVKALRRAIDARNQDEVIEWLMRFVAGDDDVEGSRLFAEIIAESSRNPRIACIFTQLQQELRSAILSALALLAPRAQGSDRMSNLADVMMTMSLGILQHRLMLPQLEVQPIIAALQSIVSERLRALQQEGETSPAIA